MSKLKIAVVGGDKRQLHLSEMLSRDGFSVSEHGLGTGVDFEEISMSDICVLPMPASDGKGNVRSPLSKRPIELSALVARLKPGALLLAGKAEKDLVNLAGEHGIALEDYLLREELAVLNAIPTAEGALSIAMDKREETLFGANVLITGLGRISKVLLKLLAAFGAHVTVAARKPQDRVWSLILGAEAGAEFGELAKLAGQFDIIINTVPQMVIDERIINALKPDCLVIDLASSPGGIDFVAAERSGISVEWALSLPGKVAPKSAAAAIYAAVVNVLREKGML